MTVGDRVLDAIKQFQAARGRAPLTKEIEAAMSRSHGVVCRGLRQLRDEKRITLLYVEVDK